MKLEKITGQLSALITAGVLALASPNYAYAKVTKVEKRRDGTIARIYDDAVKEGKTNETKEGDRVGAYLYPIRFCDKCKESHPDTNRKKVELGFQTRSGRVVDYLPQTRRPQSEVYSQPTEQEVRDFDNQQRNARQGAIVEEMLGIPSPYRNN